MILAEDLRKTYGQHVAVDGLDLSIAKGETLGLLGPNGAGKTTTINMLVGLLRPDSGRVAIGDSLDPSQTDSWSKLNPCHPDVRKSVGVAPQTLSVYEELTAKENLKFFGGLYGLAGKLLSKRIDWALDFSELQDRKNDRVETFSGGMKRRLNIAIALIHEPTVLLLDEPTVGVDPQSRNHIFESIQALQEKGLTIIYTTHYMEEAQRLCDRVAIMDHGKLLDVAPVQDLINRHGGQTQVAATLKELPNGKLPSGFKLPGKLDGLELRFDSANAIEEISRITNAGVQFQNLTISQPDLEGVFLNLTGRSLRD